jgi:tetratricopeptide (TPR) repeat protein
MLADALNTQGLVAFELGDPERGMAILEESLALGREFSGPWSVAQTLGSLGEVTFARGDYERAALLTEESLALFRQVGDISNVAMARIRLGHVRLASGDATGAASLFHEALLLACDLGDTRAITECFEAFAMVLSAAGKGEHARGAAPCGRQPATRTLCGTFASITATGN